MSGGGDKVKVFTLAKRYGFKSAEFVEHLRKIGFPVTSYQASLSTWDVPVIEERLVRGGLMDASKATTMEESESKEAESDGGLEALLKKAVATKVEEPKADEVVAEAPAEAPVEADQEESVEFAEDSQPTPPTEAAEETSPEPVSSTAEPVADAEADPPPAAAEAVPTEAPEAIPIPTPQPSSSKKRGVPTPVPAAKVIRRLQPRRDDRTPPAQPAAPNTAPAAAAEAPSQPATESESVAAAATPEPQAPAQAPEPAVSEAASPPQAPAAETAAKAEAAPFSKAKDKPKAASEAPKPAAAAAPAQKAAAPKAKGKQGAPGAKKDGKTKPPSPKPRPGATKVGKIDLATLGLVKAKQQRDRKSVTFTDVRDRESERRRDFRTRQRERMKSRRAGTLGPRKISTQERKTDVTISLPVNVKSFSVAIGVGVNQLLGALMKMGTMANINAVLDEDTIQLLATEFNVGIRLKQQEDVEESLMEEIAAARDSVEETKLSSRPPVIAFLGHVDHGKTSLIDAVRTTRVAEGEAGGITQHIGAYMVDGPTGQPISIIDTPGHAAFTAMRARGAKTTDIVILVVAADDGVMPQTEEAANHAKAAEVPIIIALNKIDKANANPEQVKAQLANIDLQPEDWGGQYAVVPVSAIQKTGIDELLERVLLESELLDLKANGTGNASGTVLEATTSEGKGKVAHVLVQDGTLRVGDAVLAGPAHGTVRLMYDHNGKTVSEAGPSTPVEILGLNDLPQAGEPFYAVRDLASAKDVAEKRVLRQREAERAEKSKVSLENLFDHLEDGEAKRVNLIVKADVQGSLEVLAQALLNLSNDEVKIRMVHTAVGSITESDVTLAETTGAIILGFNVSPDEKARATAERASIDIRRYNVIYELLEDMQLALEGLLAPDLVEEVTGHAEVRRVFPSSRLGNIAGCFVLDGEIKRSHKMRVLRGGKEVFKGDLDSLRRDKDDTRQVRAGLECGIRIRNFDAYEEGDILEAFELVEKARRLGEADKG